MHAFHDLHLSFWKFYELRNLIYPVVDTDDDI